MSDSPKTSNFDRFTRITEAIGRIGIVLGVVAGAVGLVKTSHDLKDAARSARMNALPEVRQLVKDDIGIRREMRSFLIDYDKDKLTKKLDDFPTVDAAYRSPELLALQDAGSHYEEMGALVKSGYVDFDLVYELVDFPDDFWDTTESLRERAKTKWSKRGGLPDFWKNFAYLHCRYDTRRKGEPEPAEVCRDAT
jgi:hypothetical protein